MGCGLATAQRAAEGLFLLSRRDTAAPPACRLVSSPRARCASALTARHGGTFNRYQLRQKAARAEGRGLFAARVTRAQRSPCPNPSPLPRAPVFSSQPQAPRCVMRASILSASVTMERDGWRDKSPQNPTPHASLSLPGSKSPCAGGTALIDARQKCRQERPGLAGSAARSVERRR